jgi:hypothetical protein
MFEIWTTFAVNLAGESSNFPKIFLSEIDDVETMTIFLLLYNNRDQFAKNPEHFDE